MRDKHPFRSRHRRASGTLLAVLLVTALVGAFVAWKGVSVLRRYEAARNVTTGGDTVPKTLVGLWATVDSSDVLGSLTAIVEMPGSTNGGHLISIPVSGDGGGSDLASSFRQEYLDGGVESMQISVEAALNVTFDFVQVSKPSEFDALIRPVLPVSVDLPDAVPGNGPSIAAGKLSMNGEQLAAVLNRRGNGLESTRRDNTLAVWRGIAAAVGQGKTTFDAATQPTTFAELLTRVLAGPVDVAGLSAKTIDAERNPNRLDVEQIDIAQSVLVFAAISPSNMSSPSQGLKYRLEAPANSTARLYDAIATLIYLGGNVVQVGLNGTEQAATLVTLADSRDKARVEENPLFGKVEYKPDRKRIAGVDVQMSLGSDYLNKPASGEADPSASTTTNSDSVVSTTSTTGSSSSSVNG